MNIQLIAIDVDGTLLNPQHQVTQAVKGAIAAARDKGVRVVLATGRPYLGVQKYLRELNMQSSSDYCITNNGSLVQNIASGEYILRETLSFDDYCYFEAMARELGVHFHAFDFNTLYTADKDISKYTIQEVFLNGVELKYRAVSEMDKSLRFPKVMMVDEPALLDNAIARIPEQAFARFTIMKSADHYLEILSKQADKGVGVKMLAEHLGIAQENIMALGDQSNDSAMIRYAGLGVAMGNAIPELKVIAQYITGTNVENGVAQAIERFVL